MSDIRISASSTNLGRISAGDGAAGGSPAQQAYDRAVRRLAEAQKQLAQDVIDRAPEETIKVSQAMVEAAAAAVAAAAAALAREQAGAQRSEQPGSAQVTTPPHGGDVDVYA